MINLGFKELIDKLEEYFGKTFTKVVILMLTICVLVVVIGLPVTQVIYPLIIWIGAVTTGNPTFEVARSGISWVSWAIWLVLTLGLIAFAIRVRAMANSMEDVLAKMLEASALMEVNVGKSAQVLQGADQVFQEAKRAAARRKDISKVTLDLKATTIGLQESESSLPALPTEPSPRG